MSHFKKLDIEWSPELVSAQLYKGDPVIEYGELKYYEVRYLNYKLENLRNILEPQRVRWVELLPGSKTTPHIDHGITCAVNFYVIAGSSLTMFFKEKPEGAKPYSFPGMATANLYNPIDLKGVGMFSADSKEVYALDVSKIHSVVTSGIHPKRQFIQFAWTHLDYSELLNKINWLN